MSYETQSQWNLDELKKLNKAALWGMHKGYVALVIGIEVMMVVGIILSVIISSPKLITEFVVLLVGFPVALYLITTYRVKKNYNSNTMRYTGSLKQTRTSIFSWQKIRRSTLSRQTAQKN